MSRFQVGGRVWTDNTAPMTIAETGMCHNNNMDRAIRLVDAIYKAGFDVFKTQCYKTQNLYSPKDSDLYNNASEREPDYTILRIMKERCKELDLAFCISCHDDESLDWAVRTLAPDILKVGSGECRNWDFIIKCMDTDLPLIISTGMCDTDDIVALSELIMFRDNTAILHCMTEYPHTIRGSCLYNIVDYKKSFFPAHMVGFSDHSEQNSPMASSLAVAMGARILERHVDLYENENPGRDRQVSMTGFVSMAGYTLAVHDAYTASNTCSYTQAKSDDNTWARKSPYATRDIRSGDLLDKADYVLLRPGGGVPPDAIHNRQAKLYIPAGTCITEDHLMPLLEGKAG